jgi:hypothetical protein
MEHTDNFRLILLDDYTNRPEMTEYLLEIQHILPTTIVMHTEKQQWFTRASNRALAQVTSEFAILLNSDCEVGPFWTKELFDTWRNFEKAAPHKRLGLVGSVHSPGCQYPFIETQEPNYVTGHCWLLKMSIMAEMAERRGWPGKYLDESRDDCIHINSDRLFCYELNRAGYSTVISNWSHVAHAGGKSWNYDMGKMPSRISDLER